jgi:hypothetical protein
LPAKDLLIEIKTRPVVLHYFAPARRGFPVKRMDYEVAAAKTEGLKAKLPGKTTCAKCMGFDEGKQFTRVP